MNVDPFLSKPKCNRVTEVVTPAEFEQMVGRITEDADSVTWLDKKP